MSSDTRDDRISKLGSRFQSRSASPVPPPATTRTRKRQSFYLDAELTKRLDREYQELRHALYPRDLSKSEFLEALFDYGLSHLQEIKAELSRSS